MVQWETDRRRASLYTRAYVIGMELRRDKQAFEGAEHTLRNARELQRAGDSAPTFLTRLLFRVEDLEVAGMVVWKVRTRLRRPRRHVIYVHGGGYVHPLTADYWRLARALARAPAEVVVPAYPLAPDATVDHVLPRLLDLYRQTAETDPSGPVVLMGDSAGGALVLAMAPERPRPPGAGGRGGAVAVAGRHPRGPEGGRSGGDRPDAGRVGSAGRVRWWADPRRPDDPLVSPVNGSLEGLPPLDVYIGDRDILRPAVDELVDRARQDSADLHLHEVTAMFHVWMTRATPEGRRTRRDLTRLVRRRTASR